MGNIDQTLFDSNVANTVEAARALAASLGSLPSPGTAPSEQETSNARATARDLVHKIDRFSEHMTPGTIDQATFDAEMKILLVSKDSLQKAEDDLQDSYTDFSSAANLLITDIEALEAFMTEPPVTEDVRAAKSKKSAAEARYDDLTLDKSAKSKKGWKEPTLDELAYAKASHDKPKEGRRFGGFGRRK